MRKKTASSRVRRSNRFASSRLDAVKRRLAGEDVRYVRRSFRYDPEAYTATRPFSRVYDGVHYTEDSTHRKPWVALSEKWNMDPQNWRKKAVSKGRKTRGGRSIYNKFDRDKYKKLVAKTYKQTIKPGLLRWAHRAKRSIKSRAKKAKNLRKEVKRTRRFARRHM